MAWGRVVKLTVGTLVSGFVVSDLDIDFDVQRSITLSENTAEFKIYNAKRSTREKVLKKGASIKFEAGYKDETSATLFMGNISGSNSVKNGVDWITTIKAVSGRGPNINLQNIDVSISYNAGTFITRPIQDVATLMGLVVHGIANASFPLANGWVYAGSVNGALRYLKDVLLSFGVNLYIDNNELVLHQINQTSIFNVVVLAYSGGLLNIENISISENQSIKSKSKLKEIKKKLKFTSLLIPQLQVNGLVIFKTFYLNSTFAINKLKFFGNNYGENDFNCEGEVVEL